MQCGLRTRPCIAFKEIAAMLVNSSNVGYHTTRRTFTRMLDAGAAGPPVHHCSADSPAQRLDRNRGRQDST